MIHQGRAYNYQDMGKVIALESTDAPLVRCLVDIEQVWPRPEMLVAACLSPAPMRYLHGGILHD